MSVIPDSREKILVIKLGALGDVIQALGPMRAIRDHHPRAHITCLTTAPFAALIRASRCADEVSIDSRPGNLDLTGWLTLRRVLRAGGYKRVYDLQTSSRSSRYYRLFWPGPYPEWSGIALACSHPHANPDRDNMHTIERQAEQLRMADISSVPAPSLDGVAGDIRDLELPTRYAMIVPGGAQHRPEKRWPAAHYFKLIEKIAATGITPVVVGAGPEARLAQEVCLGIPEAMNITNRTDLLQLVSVARGAAFAVGNDSGPMHIAAVVGIPTVVLYSHASDPALCAQRGPSVSILRKPSLTELSMDEVWSALPVD